MADENGKDLVEEASEKVTDSAGEVVDQGKEKASDAVEAAKDAAGGIADKAGDAGDAASDAVEKGKELVGDAASAVSENAGDAVEKGKELVGDAASAVSEKAGDAVDKGKEVIGDAAGAVSGAAGAAVDKVDGALGSVTDAFDGDGDSGSMLKWLLPLLLLGLLMVLMYMFFSRSGSETPPANTNVSNSNNSEVVGEAEESALTIAANPGKYMITGVVPDEKTKNDILTEAEAVWGTGAVDVSGVTVNANAKPFKDGWWDGFKNLLPSLKDWKDGSIGWAEGAIKTVGDVPADVAGKIKSLFAGWTLPVSIAGVEDAAKAANEKALELLSGADSVEKVIEGLNASIINFASGKSDVPDDAKPVLEKAAEVLKKQSEGTVIEIGGHTDNVGNAESNMKLSAARAESVRKALVELGVSEKMLAAKGYGDKMPKGENDSEEGRFANRRIEYKVGGAPDNTGADTSPEAEAQDKPDSGN